MATVAIVYFEIALYILSSIIILTVLIVESASWYFASRTKQTTTNIANTVEMSAVTITKKSESTIKKSESTPKSSKSENSVTSNTSIANNTSVSSNNSVDVYARLLPISMYIFYICCATTQNIARFGIGIHRNCDYLGISGFFFMAAKCCLYLALLYRLFKVYSGSIFRRSTMKLKIAALFTFLWALFVAVLNLITVQKVFIIIDGNVYCGIQSHPIAVLSMLIYDITLNFGCCYAFTRPLLWLTQMKKRSNEADVMFDAVIRYFVLTVVAVASTFLLMFAVIAVGSNGFSLIDMAVNSVCIMLFNKRYESFYHCICCGAHKIGYIVQMKCCCGPKEADEKESQDTEV